MIKLNAD